MKSNRSFGKWLKQLRETFGLTQEELGALVGYSKPMIQKIETDARQSTTEAAQKMADIFELPSNERGVFLKAARTPYQYSTNLLAPPTPLVGRDDLVTAVRRELKLKTVRLLVLTGEPGIGKTRLALAVASGMFEAFSDGVFFVNLSAISDPALVVSAIAQELGVQQTGGQPPLEALKAYLYDKELLLILDTFEHVINAAPQIAKILETAPLLKVIITSRELLHIYVERHRTVPPLALPNLKPLPSVEELGKCAAIDLFVQRAQAAKTEFRLTATNARFIAEICVRLEGLPLAIELAAARVKILTSERLLERLASQLTTLIGGARDLPARQQTLRGAIDWSYDLLNPAEQVLFARLAVFINEWTLEAAETICHTDRPLPINMLDGLASLMDKSLLRQEDGLDGEQYFKMLDSLREYAYERLIASGEAQIIQDKHAAYYLELAEVANQAFGGSKETMWLNRLEKEEGNLRVALGRAHDRNDAAIVLRLCGALWRFWSVRGVSVKVKQGLLKRWLLLIPQYQMNPLSFLLYGPTHLEELDRWLTIRAIMIGQQRCLRRALPCSSKLAT